MLLICVIILISSSAVVGGPNSMESSMKAARAALMLVPILGVHFVLLPMRPDSGSALEDIYLIASAIASSYQVRILYSLDFFLYRGFSSH